MSLDEVDPAIFLALFGLVCLGAMAVGLRFYRRAEVLRLRMKDERGERAESSEVRRLGLMLMIVGPLVFLFAAAMVMTGQIEFSTAGRN